MLDSQADREYIAAMQYVDESVRGHLERFCKLLAGEPDRDELRSVLENLSAGLHRHFELEEQDGYFSEAVGTAPRLADEADRLLRQHPVLSEEVKSLLEGARGSETSSEWWSAYLAQANKFVEMLVEHERAENNLVQSAYEEDIGDKD